MLTALTNQPSPRINECELTYQARAPIDYQRAVAQHHAYGRALELCGAQVRELAVNRDSPDGAFVEDVAVVLDEVAVIASMGAASRRAEVEPMAAELSRHRELRRIEWPATLEGGDVLRLGRTLCVGVTSRTNAFGLDSLRRIVEPLGYRVVTLEVRGCLHLKSCCTAIDETTVLVNTAWLGADAVDRLRAEKIEMVSVPADEPNAANVLSLPGGAILAAAHPRTAEMLSQRGRSVKPVDLSEFAKAEACATCLSLVFENEQ